MARLSKEAKSLLVAISDAVNAGGATPYLFVDPKAVKPLTGAKPPFALVNASLPDPTGAGRLAAITTDEGKAEAERLRTAKPRAAPAPTPAPTFAIEIESGIDVPETKRGRGAAENPWNATIDKLTVGQSFFIPVTEEVPEPAKRYASLASAANKRYNKEGSTDRRRFILRPAEKAGQAGARFWRIEDAKPGTSAADADAQAKAAQPPAGTAGFGS